MKAISKVDVINKYVEPRKVERPMTAPERKEYRKDHPNAKEEDLVVVEKMPRFYCKAGEEITILSNNPGAWQIVVTCANKQDDRFCIRWDELDIL